MIFIREDLFVGVNGGKYRAYHFRDKNGIEHVIDADIMDIIPENTWNNMINDELNR